MALNQSFDDPYPAMFKKFQQYLYNEYMKGHHVMLVIDEAQNLSVEMLEELRMLSNINADKQQFLQIILIGQPQLKDILRTPALHQFAQRVSSDFHLKPLNVAEVKEYIDYRLKAVGAQSQLFSDAACHLIAEASRGIPRTINILCDTAMVYGFAANAKVITSEIVRTVIENKAQYGVLPLTAAPSEPVAIEPMFRLAASNRPRSEPN
jgi:general secretion pathway protein A